MIQIKRNNKVFFTIEDFGEGSKLSYQLMDHHYIILKFTTAMPVYFEIGDSVEIPDFGYFELTSAYFPKHNDSDGYDYEMQMDAYYMAWKNKLCKYRPQYGANETSFKLTTSVGVHMNVILGNLKALGLTYNGKDFSVDYTTYNNKAFDVQKRFLIEYGSISIIDALNSICSEDALNCEWWIDGSIIYLGYCEVEGQTTFEQNVNVLSMSYSESKSTYITRLYAFGSDRNIPKGYFTGADADVTTDGVATDYLMLPNKEVDSDGFYAKDGYLENVNVVKNDKQAVEGVVMFEDEYPKVECAVSNIKTYDSTVEKEDGTKTTQTFWQVTATDSFATSFETSWIKKNLTLGIKFTSGALMGMEFEVSFKVIDNVNYFEIIANDTYGRTLPDGVMCPKVGDKFFLYNWDATKITDSTLIPTAQLSLLERAKQYYQKTMISNSNFTCTMDGGKFYNNGIFDYHPLGEQVKLINDMFSQVDADGKHYRNSRIIGMDIPLDIPYDHPQYTVGEKAATSRLGKLEDKVDSITVNGMQIGGVGSGGGVYVIGTNDSTPVTDSNVYSARKANKIFLRKDVNDIAQGIIRFMQGLKLGDGEKGIDADGNAVLGTVTAGDAVLNDVVVDRVHDAKSTPAERVVVGAQGFDLYMGEDGKSHLYVDYLTTRVKMFAASAEVRKVSYSGGTTIFSNAGSTIVKVAYIFDATGSKVIAYKCYSAADDGTTRTMNWWHVGMMALCQTFNVKAQRDGEALANRYYWRLVVGVGQEVLSDGKLYDYVILSNVKEFRGSDGVPCYGIKLLADGQNNVLSWGGVAVSVVSDNGMTSFASVFNGIEGGTQDDGDSDIASRRFYGYEPAEGGGEPNAPAPNDVIVQVGDQVRWKKYGNLIKLTTSTEDNATDNATDNAPAIAMYHGMGAPYVDKKSGNTNPYQWKTLTSLDSPELVLKNANKFKFFTNDDPEDVVSPISTTYEIVASADSLVRDPKTLTVTPADITFSTVKRYGSKTETLTTLLYRLVYTTQDGIKHTVEHVPDENGSITLSQFGVNLYEFKEINISALRGLSTVLASRTIAVLTDGEKGDKGDKGADTVSLVATPSTLVFGTDDKGKARGQAVVQVQFYADSSIKTFLNTPVFKTENFEEGYTPTRQGEVMVIIDASKIKAQKIVDTADGTDRYVSCTSASVTITDTHNGKQYQVKIPIFVDVESYISRMEMTAKQYKQTFEALKSDLGKENPDILTKFNSTITQRADAIALEVTKTNEGLQKAGVYLDSGEIKMKADKTKFVTVKDGNEVEVSVFDKDGLNADLINAKHVWAKSEDGTSTVGHFGNYEIPDCEVSKGVYAPLFVGSATAAKAPFYVDSTGAIKATSGEIANFVITSSGLRSGIKGTTDYLYLGDFQVVFVSRNSRDKVRLGSCVLSPSTGYAQSGLYIESTHDFENYESIQVNIGSYIEVGGKQHLRAVRTLPDDDETQYFNGNHALYIQKGDVVGLRPMLTVATESRNILKRECVIMCIPPRDTTIILTLPDDPEVGQHYTIINKTGHWKNGANGGIVRIQSREGKGKSIFRYTAENSWSFDIVQIYTVTEIWFDGDNWLLQYYAQY